MSRIAARCREAADDRLDHRRLRPRPALAGALVLAAALAPLLAAEAAAQSRSGIVINNDVLNSLGPGPEAPLAPLAPDAPATPLSPRSQWNVQAPAVPSSGSGNDDGGSQTYGNGNVVMTRPGTLLFPPLEAPDSTLTPGFAGSVDNRAARARALDDAFAEGPEPRSQLLIPLDGQDGGSDSVVVFMENLPQADPDADHSAAPVLVLREPPQPPAPKPEVPAAALAALQPEPVEEVELAPEFVTANPIEPESPAPDMAAQSAPVSEPAPTEAEAAAVAPAEPPAPEPMAPEPMAPEGTARDIASAEPESEVSPDSVPAPVMEAAPADEAPVSLLPEAQPRTPAPVRPEAAAVPEPQVAAEQPVAGVQTVSLAVEPVEDTSFLFDVDSAELTPEARSGLQVLAEALHGEAADIQVLGFASGRDGSEDQARKLALSRALKVRSFLIDAGIASTRIRVRSLGDRTDGGPANRVDIKPIGS